MISPILANIYLHEFDDFMEAEVVAFNRGKKRRANPQYAWVSNQIAYRRGKAKKLDEAGGDRTERQRLITEIKELTRTMRTLPSKDPMDPAYRRLTYVRYADDFLIGVNGSKAEAKAVLDKVRAFLKDTLRLDVSEDKTGIVRATDGARFLGYDIRTKSGVRIANIQQDGFVATKRCAAELVILCIPPEKLQGFCNKHGYGDYVTLKATHRDGLIQSSDFEIVSIYNAELRGFVNYYRLDARVKSRVGQLAWVANKSLMRTLTRKHKTKLGSTLGRIKQGPGRLIVKHAGRNGRTLEVAVWTPKDIRFVGKVTPAADVDRTPLGAVLAGSRTDVTDRLLAGRCENTLCTSPPGTSIQVHHVRALADVGRSSFVEWLTSARSRKTRYLCVNCHRLIHDRHRQSGVRYAKGEPGAVKAASPVRGGGALRPNTESLLT